MLRLTIPAGGATLNILVQVKKDASIALKHALIQIGGDEHMTHRK